MSTPGLNPQGNRLTRQVIPRVLQRCDPYRAYVPSSPYVPPALAAEPDVVYLPPEQHLWGPRGYFKSPFYTQHSAHFVGEIGYHGCPNVSSLRRFLSPSCPVALAEQRRMAGACRLSLAASCYRA